MCPLLCDEVEEAEDVYVVLDCGGDDEDDEEVVEGEGEDDTSPVRINSAAPRAISAAVSRTTHPSSATQLKAIRVILSIAVAPPSSPATNSFSWGY